MKWLSERPRSVIEMWNILCEAIYERREFYGLEDQALSGVEKIPALPFEKVNLPLFNMRQAVMNLVCSSVDPHDFGKFVPMDAGSYYMDDINKPDGAFFEERGIDGYAFHHVDNNFYTLPERPRAKYSVSDFFNAAAKILNDAALYPEPLFRSRCKAEVHDFVADEHHTASYPEDENLFIENDNGAVWANWGTLAEWRIGIGNSRTYDLRGRYPGAGTLRDNLLHHSYKLPVLHGTVPLLYSGEVRYSDNTVSGSIKLGEVSNVLNYDAASGKTDQALDFSAYQSRINEIMGFEPEEKLINEENGRIRGWVGLYFAGSDFPLAKLSTENFDELPYKYRE